MFAPARVGNKKFAQLSNKLIPVNYVRYYTRSKLGLWDFARDVLPAGVGYAHAGKEVALKCEKYDGISCHFMKHYIQALGETNYDYNTLFYQENDENDLEAEVDEMEYQNENLYSMEYANTNAWDM